MAVETIRPGDLQERQSPPASAADLLPNPVDSYAAVQGRLGGDEKPSPSASDGSDTVPFRAESYGETQDGVEAADAGRGGVTETRTEKPGAEFGNDFAAAFESLVATDQPLPYAPDQGEIDTVITDYSADGSVIGERDETERAVTNARVDPTTGAVVLEAGVAETDRFEGPLGTSEVTGIRDAGDDSGAAATSATDIGAAAARLDRGNAQQAGTAPDTSGFVLGPMQLKYAGEPSEAFDRLKVSPDTVAVTSRERDGRAGSDLSEAEASRDGRARTGLPDTAVSPRRVQAAQQRMSSDEWGLAS